MPSIDFNLPIREQLYLLPYTEEVKKEEKDFLLEFMRTQYAIFFRKETVNRASIIGSNSNNINSKYYDFKGITKRDVENIIKRGKTQNLTFKIAVSNLSKEAKKLNNQKLVKRVEKLEKNMESLKLSQYVIMTGTHRKGLKEKEIQIAYIMIFIEASLTLDLKPLSEVSRILGINNITIKQACQDGRIIARKYKNGWLCCVSEAAEYWSKNGEGVLDDKKNDIR